ncbi:MAG: hypothetical protein K8F56_12605 [Rhodocyclaceae bacterium]|nr:hypothetical protein [Rhodocyclaceae bacterium]
MANTQHSFSNIGELYIGDPVSARNTAAMLSLSDDEIGCVSASSELSVSLSTKVVDNYVNYAWAI